MRGAHRGHVESPNIFESQEVDRHPRHVQRKIVEHQHTQKVGLVLTCSLSNQQVLSPLLP
jgi:hypothetical protein